MDKENLEQFLDYWETGNAIPFDELAELQNVISLIPTILELETPDPSLKRKVAQKLKSYQNEIKNKIKIKKDTSTALNMSSVKSITDFEPIDNEDPMEYYNPPIDKQKKPLKEETQPRSDKPKSKGTKIETPIDLEDLSHDYIPETAPVVIKSSSNWPWIIVFVVVVISAGAFFFYFQNTAQMEEKFRAINSEKELAEHKLEMLNESINNQKPLIDILNTGIIEIVNFEATDSAQDASARLYVSLKKGEAVLEVEKMPALPTGENYQLWMVKKDK